MQNLDYLALLLTLFMTSGIFAKYTLIICYLPNLKYEKNKIVFIK